MDDSSFISFSLHMKYFYFLDVDECSEDSDGCEHTCINTPGSFVCDCNSGYFLNLDKKTCQGKKIPIRKLCHYAC